MHARVFVCKDEYARLFLPFMVFSTNSTPLEEHVILPEARSLFLCFQKRILPLIETCRLLLVLFRPFSGDVLSG